VAYAQKLITAPFSAVWEAASGLEQELPQMITDLRSFEITSTRGERMTARARGRLGQRASFDVMLRPRLVRDAKPVPHRRHGRRPGRERHPVRLPRRPPPPRDTAARPAASPPPSCPARSIRQLEHRLQAR
jgi:hypothetical protein